MITDAPLLTVRRGFPRPPADLIALLTGLSTGHLVDAMGGRGALHHAIKPTHASLHSLCGVALTCAAGPADNLAVFGAAAIAQPGDVIVAATDAFHATAVTGDLLLGMAANRGAAGFVTDGAIRDVEGIAAVPMPCFAAAISPNSPARNGPGTVGLPVVIGGVAVASGDIVVADKEGVVIVPAAEFATIADRLAAVREAERHFEAAVKGGLEIPGFIEELFASGRVREI